jgi:hypothetical protein
MQEVPRKELVVFYKTKFCYFPEENNLYSNEVTERK